MLLQGIPCTEYSFIQKRILSYRIHFWKTNNRHTNTFLETNNLRSNTFKRFRKKRILWKFKKRIKRNLWKRRTEAGAEPLATPPPQPNRAILKPIATQTKNITRKSKIQVSYSGFFLGSSPRSPRSPEGILKPRGHAGGLEGRKPEGPPLCLRGF